MRACKRAYMHAQIYVANIPEDWTLNHKPLLCVWYTYVEIYLSSLTHLRTEPMLSALNTSQPCRRIFSRIFHIARRRREQRAHVREVWGQCVNGFVLSHVCVCVCARARVCVCRGIPAATASILAACSRACLLSARRRVSSPTSSFTAASEAKSAWAR